MAYQFVSGPYNILYAGTSVGTTAEGITLREEKLQRDIMTDEHGEGVTDMLVAGSNCFVEFDFVEYTKMLPALYAANGGSASQGDIFGNVGKLMSALGGILNISPVDTRNNNNQTFIASTALVVNDIEILLSSRLRQGPITFRLLPDPTTGEHYAVS
ncbi:MAG: hypothetical protein KOO65_08555 [Desulfobacterales bacterium]|nr:hypothetical protein [Desulfobacterales bacterium]